MGCIIETENILLQVQADTWEEALVKSGELLVKSGYIKKGYIDKTIEGVKEFGPYIVIGPGLALAHARPDENVLKTGISLVALRQALDFGSELGPVRVVITLAAVDDSSHIDKLQVIAGLLSDEENMERVCRAEDPESVAGMFNSFEI